MIPYRIVNRSQYNCKGHETALRFPETEIEKTKSGVFKARKFETQRATKHKGDTKKLSESVSQQDDKHKNGEIHQSATSTINDTVISVDSGKKERKLRKSHRILTRNAREDYS